MSFDGIGKPITNNYKHQNGIINYDDGLYIDYDHYNELESELEGLKSKINSAEINDFIEGVRMEALYQRQKFGTNHDLGKSPEEWLWLIGFLATKATQANRYGDKEKYLHHIISSAAACLNWHANATGKNKEMKPGAPDPKVDE